jgi:hypothetical protein
MPAAPKPLDRGDLALYVVTIANKRRTQRIVWGKYVSRGGAVAIVRELKAKNIDARIEEPSA